MKYFFNIKMLVLLFGISTSWSLASDNIANSDVDISEIDISELKTIESDFEAEMMLFEDRPIVYLVSRSEQKINDLSIPVNIIDADDIHYSGLTNVSDILKYSLGLDVLPASRNRYRVSMGGLCYSYYDRNVTLIDGRNLNSSVTGGTDYLRIPIFLEDIGRVQLRF